MLSIWKLPLGMAQRKINWCTDKISCDLKVKVKKRQLENIKKNKSIETLLLPQKSIEQRTNNTHVSNFLNLYRAAS